VRLAAALGLGYLSHTSPDVAEALKNTLGDASEEMRVAAAVSLGYLDQISSEVNEVLINGASSDSEFGLQIHCINLLGLVGKCDERIVDTLLMGFSSDTDVVRSACTGSLVTLGNRHPHATERIAPKLIELLNDSTLGATNNEEGRTDQDNVFDCLWQLIVTEQPDVR